MREYSVSNITRGSSATALFLSSEFYRILLMTLYGIGPRWLSINLDEIKRFIGLSSLVRFCILLLVLTRR